MNAFMMKIIEKTGLLRWLQEEKATAFTETVILMPVLVSMLMGCYDLGQGITTNQKVIGASQVMGDLIARDRTIDMAGVQEVITAGQLVLQPYSTAPFGYDIVSIEFDTDGSPLVLWRVTENMSENEEAVASTVGLGAPGEGILVVTTSYTYDPFFSNFIVDAIDMQEVAFYRGRRGSIISCNDCPV
jgi:Flp pilus assembly protein TadG